MLPNGLLLKEKIMKAENEKYIVTWNAPNCGVDFATMIVKLKSTGETYKFHGVLRRRHHRDLMSCAEYYMQTNRAQRRIS